MISHLPGDQNTDQKGRKLKWEEKEKGRQEGSGSSCYPLVLEGSEGNAVPAPRRQMLARLYLPFKVGGFTSVYAQNLKEYSNCPGLTTSKEGTELEPTGTMLLDHTRTLGPLVHIIKFTTQTTNA